MELRVKVEKKHLYYLIGFAVLILIAAVTIAQTTTTIPNPGHAADEIGEGTIADTLTVSDEKVGIGTTSPSHPLNVVGSANITGNIYTESTAFFGNGVPANVYNYFKTDSREWIVGVGQSGGDDKFLIQDSTATTTRFLIDTSGNVGIGTTTPAEKLDVSGNIKSTNLAGTSNRCLYADSGGVLHAKTQDCGTATGGDDLGSHIATQSISMDNNNIDGVNQLIFTSPTANNWRLATYNDDKLYIVREASKFVTVDNAGNVGIGTTSPGQVLDVNGNIRSRGGNWQSHTGSAYVAAYYDALTHRFDISGSPKMSIDSSGNVGIGTTSPTSGVKLEVVGANSKFQLTDTGFLYGGYNGAGSFSITPGSWSNGNLILNAAGSGNIILGNSVGNVGIGTSSPSSKLDIRGKVYIYNSGQDAQLMLDSNTNQAILQGPTSRGLGFQLTGTSGANSRFFFRNIAGTDIMYIADSGNVGIGTTSPLDKLHVNGKLRVATNTQIYDNEINRLDNSNLYLQHSYSGNVIMVTGGGNVGIGTTNPQYGKLQVDGDVGLSLGNGVWKVRLGNPNYGSALLNVYNGDQGNGIPVLDVGTNWGSALFVTNTGNVGIGTTSPSVKLQVAGTVKATAFNTGDIVFNKDDKPVWRMFEDEDGLYLESLKTSKKYKFILEEVS